ncbi:B-box zinc finger family protein [Tritrichomonas foetus]|uniref:B-box zinc finger family protein n=1 Tax=Tritrichomonas foetus TaxID=1144522 RepID=A0A1J4J9V0_9EUKA|nr:B-box zinc finger family protein [Tritrichomonas foetus]|eukprot:OHS94028.1 B-box zinc finger family protein [Tritrichomonas foetus]
MSFQLNDSSFGQVLEQLTEKFTCFICMDLANEPTTIPCCGQIVCRNCIQSWLNANNTCPYCRQKLIPDSLISISWASNLKKIIQLLKQTNPTDHNCQNHRKSFEFYCQTCNSYLCSECLFDELNESTAKHKSHQIVKLTHILSTLKLQIQKELKEVVPKMNTIENSLNAVIIQNTNLDQSRNSQLMEMYERFGKFKGQLDKTLAEYGDDVSLALNELLDTKSEIVNQIELIQDLLESPGSIDSSTVSKINEKIESIKGSMKCYDDLMSPPTTNELIPPFNEVQVYIPNFRETSEKFKNLPEEAHRFFYSEKIKLGGNVWRVKIYPNGNLNGEGSHLSVFLELIRGCGIPSTYYYKLEIKSLSNDPSKNITRQYTSEFVETDSWGWNKAALLENIFNGEYLDENGGLVLFLSIKPESYYQVNRDWQNAIRLKKEKYQRLKRMKNKPTRDQSERQNQS